MPLGAGLAAANQRQAFVVELHRARKLADGDRIRLPEPVTFTDGNVAQEFVVCKRGRRLVLRDPQNGCFYRISRLMTRAWVVVPVTKIHKTLFA